MTTAIDAASSAASGASATAKDVASSPTLHPTPPAPSTPAMVAPATAAQLASAALPPPPPLDAIFPSGDQIDMRLLMMALWTHRRDAAFTREVCARLAHPTALSSATLDQVEFFLPQLAHMVIHLERELPIEDVEQFVLLLSQSSVHFALQLFWIVYAALDENRPKRAGGSPRTFARCAQLLLALEQCLVYGSPVARELSELLTQNSISKAEMEQLLLADRRFFAASQRADAEESASDGLAARAEGWLFKKGGGTRAMGRRNWRRRWCRIDRRVLLVFAGPGDAHPRTAVPLDRAEVRVVENPKHPFYFELIHEFSETTMKFAAPSQDELVLWMQHLHRAAAAPEPPASRTGSRLASASASGGGGGNARATLARMSWGMRSFILDASATGTTTTGESGDDAGDAPASPSKAANAVVGVSPPASPRAKSQAPSPFGATDAWSESQRRTRAVSSVSSASAHSSEASDLSSVLLAEALLQQQPALPYDQQKRYEFFTGMITFVKSITDVSESLRRVEPPKRKSLLRPRLEALTVPRNAYIPLCKSTDVYCRVRAVLASEGRVFNTNERAPCLLYVETEEDALGQDVSQALFEYLYAEDDDEGVAGSEQDPAVVVDSVDDDMLCVPVRSPKGERTHSPAAGGNGRSPASERSPFLEQLLSDPERKQRIEKIFGELSFSAAARLQQSASDPARWRLSTLIAKSYDDLRQEVLVMQLITYFDRIFRAEELPLRLHPYRILSTGASTGLIEVVRNATSLDCIKKSPGFKNLRHHFEQLYGGGEGACGDAELLRQAELNFTHSLAAYSIVCYILSIKDRHNGNIMLDVEGHLVHIDFGFFLGRAPGGSFSFETAPFKLTAEMVDVLGGRQSSLFQYYRELCVKGALAARKHADTIYALVEVMSLHSRMPCFAGNASTTTVALAGLRERLFLTTPEDKIEAAILQMIERSYDHFGTTKYDQFQVYSNGIAK